MLRHCFWLMSTKLLTMLRAIRPNAYDISMCSFWHANHTLKIITSKLPTCKYEHFEFLSLYYNNYSWRTALFSVRQSDSRISRPKEFRGTRGNWREHSSSVDESLRGNEREQSVLWTLSVGENSMFQCSYCLEAWNRHAENYFF